MNDACIPILPYGNYFVILSTKFDKFVKTMDIVKKALGTLGFSGASADVYGDLILHGSSSARIIAARLGMTRPSVYDQVKILMKKGLVIERDIEGKTEFAIHDIADLGRLMESEEERIAETREAFDRERDRLSARTGSVEPKIRFFMGREAILGSMHDMLWDETLTLRVVWPYEEMLRALGRDGLLEFDRKRIRNGIRLKTIWTGGCGKDAIWGKEEWGVERRFALPGFSPTMGYTIYGDKTLFISSAKEAFGFTVTSADFASLMGEQFALLWGMSKSSVPSAGKRTRR